MDVVTTHWIKDLDVFATHKEMMRAAEALKAMTVEDLRDELIAEAALDGDSGLPLDPSGPSPNFPQFAQAGEVNGAIMYRKGVAGATELQVFSGREMAMKRIGTGWLKLGQQLIQEAEGKRSARH